MTLAFNFKEPAVDLTLLLRPFTVPAWIVVLLAMVALHLGLVLTRSRSRTEHSLSHRLAIISSWIFFVLTNAYYGGALTMFFSSEASLPFHTLEEGAGKFPTWKFLHLDDADLVLLRYLRSGGEVGLPKLLDRVLKDPDKWIVKNEAEGLSRMAQEKGMFMFTSTFPLVEAVNHGSYPNLHLKLFGEKRTLMTHFMLSNNSPYRQMLSAGSMSMLETGVVETIMLKWRGTLSPASQDGVKVLGGSHMALGFMTFLAVQGTCLSLLLIECLAKRMQRVGFT